MKNQPKLKVFLVDDDAFQQVASYFTYNKAYEPLINANE